MITHKRFMGAIAATLVLVAAYICAQPVAAQPVFTNPPCPNVTIINNGLCPVRVTFVTIPVGVWTGIALNPGESTTRPIPPSGVTVTGVYSVNHNAFNFNPPNPAPGVNCGPGMWWISSVAIGPPPGCCFDICADPASCTIWLNKIAIIPEPPCNS